MRISSKIGAGLVNLFFYLYIKIYLLKQTVTKFRRLLKIDVKNLPPKKLTISYSKFYAGYEYWDHTQKFFISFEHTVPSNRSRIALLN